MAKAGFPIYTLKSIFYLLVHSWLNPCESLTRNMSEIEILNMELSKHSKLNGLKIMRISKESFKRISEVYRFLMDKINVEDSKEGFKINRRADRGSHNLWAIRVNDNTPSRSPNRDRH